MAACRRRARSVGPARGLRLLSYNVACEDTPVERKATITVVKADGGVTVHPGDAFHYTFVVTNNGPSTVTDVGLADVLPSGLSVTGVAGAGWTGAAGAAVPVRVGGRLLVELDDVLTVSVELDIDYVGSDLLNTVDADALVDDLGDTDPSNDDRATDTDDETTPVVIEADMSIVKTVTDASPDAGGASFDWVLTVTNEGPEHRPQRGGDRHRAGAAGGERCDHDRRYLRCSGQRRVV